MKPFGIPIFIFVIIFITSCKEKQARFGDSAAESLPFLSLQKDSIIYIDSVPKDTLVYREIPSFSFINQDSIIFGSNDVKNKIVLAEFFFTSCPSICPKVSQQLKRVYKQYRDEEDFIMLSHTINPKYDNPSKLKTYADNLGVTNGNWQFLTGTKNEIYDLANFGYRTTVYFDPQQKGIESLMHSGIVVLVDHNKIIRGLYDGKDAISVNQLIKDIGKLLKELP